MGKNHYKDDGVRGRVTAKSVHLALVAGCAAMAVGGSPASAAQTSRGVAALWVTNNLSLERAARVGLPVRVAVARSDRVLRLSLWQAGRVVESRNVRLKHGGIVRVRWRLGLPVPGSYLLRARAGRGAHNLDAQDRRAEVNLTMRKKPRIVALWKMNEFAGTTMFDSDGDHDGTLYHVQVGFPGYSGLAYQFTGRPAKGYVSVPSARDLNPHSSNVTLTVHLKTTGAPGAPPKDWDLIRKGTFKGGSEYTMELQHSGRASCTFRGSRGYYYQFTAGPRVNDGRWHSLKCVKSPWSVGLLVDGKLYHRKRAVGSIANSAPVVIGARPGTDWYEGLLDNVSIAVG